MKAFKSISLVLALLIASSLLFGCEQGVDGNLRGKDSSLPQFDFGGNNVLKVLSCFETEEETKNFLRENYGLETETIIVPWDDATVRFATLVLSGDSPDAVPYRSDQKDYPNYIVNNLVQPVNSYIDLEHPFFAEVRELYDEVKWGDKNYLLVTGFGTSTCMFYNKKIFEDAGLETPWELYLKNEWDWDKMREYAIELTEDRDMDGTPERYGLAVNRPFPMIYSTGKTLGTFNGVEKTFKHNAHDPDIARAMTFLSNLVVKDKVCPTVISGALEMFGKGEVAMTFGEPFYTDPAVKAIAEQGYLGICPMARDPRVDKYYVRGQLSGIWIPDGAKNPYAAVAYYVTGMHLRNQPDFTEKRYAKLKTECFLSDENIEQVKVIDDREKCIPVREMAPWADPGSWTMVGNASTWEVELAKGLPVLEAQIEEMFSQIEVDLPTSPKVIDNFEDYGNDTSKQLNRYFAIQGGSGDLQIYVDSADKKEGEYCGKITYNVSDAPWGGLQRTINKTWENNDAMRFWLKGDGTQQQVTIRFDTLNGGMWQYSLTATGTEWQKYEIPFSEFKIPDGGLEVDFNISKVTILYLIFTQEDEERHTLYIDGLEVFKK